MPSIPLSATPPSPAATETILTFGRAAPTVPVQDMERALHFYTQVLGFTKTFDNGTPTGFAIVRRDAAELHLTLAHDHRPTARSVAHMLVSDARALHDVLVAHDTRIVKGLREVTPGLLGFVFADPDGNRIDVGQSRKDSS